MEIEASHDLITQTETRPSGILQAAKRVRMIFSVMASPNRIDILRILNSKGPLTYSELKSLAGFREAFETISCCIKQGRKKIYNYQSGKTSSQSSQTN